VRQGPPAPLLPRRPAAMRGARPAEVVPDEAV
jgi:hypothetical protein